jgi:DNA-binding transcriptional LysR family regulator
MDYFSAVHAFVRAAELQSFSKAAREMAVKTSTISRYVSDLEKDLGIALFNRSTRGLVLTEGGRVFRERAILALDALDDARQATSSLNSTPQGLLRVTMPSAFGRRHVVPHLPAFMTRYPDIDLDLVLTGDTLNMIDAGIDLAIRAGVLSDSSLMARRLAPHRRIVCGSPEYFERNGMPSVPSDLAGHESLRVALPPGDKWFLTRTANSKAALEQTLVELKGRLRGNDSEAGGMRHRSPADLARGRSATRGTPDPRTPRMGSTGGQGRTGYLGGLSTEKDCVLKGALVCRLLCGGDRRATVLGRRPHRARMRRGAGCNIVQMLCGFASIRKPD